jgi:Ca-activated chloride channel family protein
LDELYKEINKMEKDKIEARIYSDYEDKFQYFIFFALLLLLIDFVILERKNRLLRNINLFK